MFSKITRGIRFKHLAGLMAAVGLPASATVIALSADQPAYASDLRQSDSFEDVFAPFDLAEEQEILSTAERLEAEALSAAAPREVEEPISQSAKVLGRGNASYYGKRFAGRRTASGERFNPSQLTAAHRTLPFGSKVKVTSRRSGKSVVVRINDRGPFHGNRVIDLSREAARQIGLIQTGHGPVELALLTR